MRRSPAIVALLACPPAARAGALSALDALVGPGTDQGCTEAIPAGDIDGDGLGDLVLACPFDDRVAPEAGAVAVVTDLAAVDGLAALDDHARWWTGEMSQDYAASTVAVLGDATGDGLPDLAVGAPEADGIDPVSGRVYLLEGATILASASGGSLGDQPSLVGDGGWTRFGGRVYGPGDLDGDGLAELAAASIYPTPGGDLGVAWIAVMYGVPGGWPDGALVTVDPRPTDPSTTADVAFLVDGDGTMSGRAALFARGFADHEEIDVLVGAPGASLVEAELHPEHAEGAHPPGAILAWTLPTRDPAASGAERVHFEDAAWGILGGTEEGDALPWRLVQLADGRVAASAPEAAHGLGQVMLLSQLPALGRADQDAELTWNGSIEGGLFGWGLDAAEGLVPDALLAVGEPGWEGGEGRVRILGEDHGQRHAGGAPTVLGTLEGCWPEGLAGTSVRVGLPPDPWGAPERWLVVTAPEASTWSPRDGLTWLGSATAVLAALEAPCEATPYEGPDDADGDGWLADEDCDDDAGWRHPGAAEVCGDGIDDDCDGEADEGCGLPPEEEPVGCAHEPARAAWWLLAPVALLLLARRRREAAGLVLLLLPAGARAQVAYDARAGALAELRASAGWEYLQGPLVTADLDGEGLPDLAVGNPRGAFLAFASGEVQVLQGSLVRGTVELLDAPLTVYGVEEHDRVGTAIAAIDDDLPGQALWIGADHQGKFDTSPGEVLLVRAVFGEGRSLPANRADLVLSEDSHSDPEIRNNGDGLGTSLVNAGDLDGDGVEDVAIGAPWRDTSTDLRTTGRVWLLHGGGREWTGEGWGGFLTGDRALPAVATGTIDGATGDEALGWRLLAPGDLDGDGRDDLLAAALRIGDGSTGAVLLFDDLPMDVAIDAGDAAGTWTSLEAGAELGAGLDAADLDGDGNVEVLVGSPGADGDQGRVLLLSGPPRGTVDALQDAVWAVSGEGLERLGASVAVGPLLVAGAPLGDHAWLLDPQGGHLGTLEGPEGTGSWVGWVDDLEGDGVEEVVLVAPEADVAAPDQGLALVIPGARILAGDLPEVEPGTASTCGEDCATGCATVPAPAPAWLGLAALGALLGRRRRLALPLFLAGCGPSRYHLELLVPEDPVGGVVNVEVRAAAENLALYVDGASLAVGSGPALEVAWDTRPIAPGTHLLRAEAWDGGAEPAEEWLEVEVDPAAGDASPPSVAFVSPDDGTTFYPGDTVLVLLSIQDDIGIAEVTLDAEGERLAILPPDGPWTLSWSPRAGTYTLCATATDFAGHEGRACVSIEVRDT